MLRTRQPPPRRGVILLVVLTLLTIFAIVGLSFALYAGSAATSARFYRESQNDTPADIDAERLFAYFLGQLVYDTADDESGVYSGLRGHSLARNMFGLNSVIQPDGSIVYLNNDVPFNGTGRLHYSSRFRRIGETGSIFIPDAELINYTYFRDSGFLRDPERYGERTGLHQVGTFDNRGAFAGGCNAPYTYPDLNNLFLAAVKAGRTSLPNGATLPPGTVLMPSFHRPWLFRPQNESIYPRTLGSFDPRNPLWTDPRGKYLLLRPRPDDHGKDANGNPLFPYPEDEGGDVKNLIGSPGYYDPFTNRLHNNDSIWIDLGHPVMTTPDGRKYKPLFAPLVLDLDGRVNLSVAGNLRGLDRRFHGSNQGWGPWEMNPRWLLRDGRWPVGSRDQNPPTFAARRLEWPALLSGNGAWPGRYRTLALGVTPPLPSPRFYAPMDADGANENPSGLPPRFGRPTPQLRLPGLNPTAPFHCFPASLPGYGNDSVAERTNHPRLIPPFAAEFRFPASDTEALLRYGDTGSPALTSDLFRLAPLNFGDRRDPLGAARRRGLVTTVSWDTDRPGVTPWFWSPTVTVDASVYNRYPPLPPLAEVSPYPAGGEIGSPPAPAYPSHPEGDFGPDGRASANLTGLRRLDLNRYLPDYPNPGASGRIDLQTDAAASSAYVVALKARQVFAREVFELLCRITGTGYPYNLLLNPRPGDLGHQPERWEAMRRLAQLAVNIVDFIDSDDYMTPFNWYPIPVPGKPFGEWAVGTELPRVVLNEAYVEYTNVPTDPGLRRDPPQATVFKGNLWVELHNAFRDDPPLTAPWRRGAAQLEMPPSGPGRNDGYGIYRLIIAQLVSDIRQPDNVLGEPRPGTATIHRILDRFSPLPGTTPAPTVDTRMILPADPTLLNGYFGPDSDHRGFYVLGPLLDPAAESSPLLSAGGRPLETLRRPEMSFVVPAFSYPAGVVPRPSLLLQRLACPYLDHQPDPRQPSFNPYVTVDYMPHLTPNYAAVVGVPPPDPEAPAPTPVPVIERRSLGRKQPYAVAVDQQYPFPPLAGQPQHTFFQHNADSRLQGVPNWRRVPPGNAYPPFDWLVHLDRHLVSPMELLHVSAFKPHELTQQFMTSTTSFAHRAPWLDEDLGAASPAQSHRLYRALEFFTTHSQSAGLNVAVTTSPNAVPPGLNRTVGVALTGPFVALSGTTPNGGSWQIEPGCTLILERGTEREEVIRVNSVTVGRTDASGQRHGWFTADFLKAHPATLTIEPATVSERLPGKINLNTVWEEDVFLALCDPQLSNSFNAGTVLALFRDLKKSRTVLDSQPGSNGETPSKNDRPFRSLATGLYPTGDAEFPGAGLPDTLLRRAGTSSLPILAVSELEHPYQKFELLTKIFNQVTVRSNVFAVWVTVGFFEVTDAEARPVKLGRELGREENRHVRHRMFALVDRTRMLANPGPQPRFNPRATPPQATGPVVAHLSIIE
jgi:hypothetical protein